MYNANVVQYASQKSRRLPRSVMAAELHGLVLRFNAAYVVGGMVAEILGRIFPIDVYLDSKAVFDTVTRLTPTLEKRLLIDVYAVQKSHQKGTLRSI
jgi:hypothetical protein